MRLALAAGRLDVDAVLGELTARQLEEWLAFERIEGSFGERGAWERVAHLLAMYAESHRNTKKRPRPFTVAEFLPWIERVHVPASKRLHAQLGHLVKKKPKGG